MEPSWAVKRLKNKTFRIKNTSILKCTLWCFNDLVWLFGFVFILFSFFVWITPSFGGQANSDNVFSWSMFYPFKFLPVGVWWINCLAWWIKPLRIKSVSPWVELVLCNVTACRDHTGWTFFLVRNNALCFLLSVGVWFIKPPRIKSVSLRVRLHLLFNYL